MRHRRHSFATEMLRLRVSLPALMQLLGHKDIRMTLRYVQVIQPDLQREFHLARQNAPLHRLPTLPIPHATLNSDLAAIHQASRLLATFWRCTGAASPTRKSAASSNAWTAASWRSPITWITSRRPKNEERLAGQLTQHPRTPLQSLRHLEHKRAAGLRC